MLKDAIGKRIKELRVIRKEMSQEELGNIIGFDRGYISKIETGKQNITIENLNQICNALDVTLFEFFKDFDMKFEDNKVEEDKNNG